MCHVDNLLNQKNKYTTLHYTGVDMNTTYPHQAGRYDTYIFAVLRLGEVNEVIIVHVLGFKKLTVLLLTQILWVDAISPQEFLVGHTKGLSNGLGYELSLIMKFQLASSQ